MKEYSYFFYFLNYAWYYFNYSKNPHLKVIVQKEVFCIGIHLSIQYLLSSLEHFCDLSMGIKKDACEFSFIKNLTAFSYYFNFGFFFLSQFRNL